MRARLMMQRAPRAHVIIDAARHVGRVADTSDYLMLFIDDGC